MIAETKRSVRTGRAVDSIFKKTSSHKTVSETVRYRFGDVMLKNFLVNGEIVRQEFETKAPKKSHPFSKLPALLRFAFYGDTSFLNKVSFCSQKSLPNGSFVEDVSVITEDDLNNVLAMDVCCLPSFCYKINSPYPLSHWVSVGRWGGFTSEIFDVEKAQKVLSKIHWVKNVNLICGVLSFSFKPSDELIKKLCDAYGSDFYYQFFVRGVTHGSDPFGLKKSLRP